MQEGYALGQRVQVGLCVQLQPQPCQVFPNDGQALLQVCLIGVN